MTVETGSSLDFMSVRIANTTPIHFA